MGSMIHLAVGRLEIDWGKNSGFVDHSMLFQGEKDVANVPYYYAGEDREDGGYDIIVEYKEGLSRPLRLIVDRLDLLGHTSAHARREFEYLSGLNSFDLREHPFERLQEALASVDVSRVSADYGEGGEDFGKFFRRQIAGRLDLVEYDSQFSQGMENISSWTILRLLSANPTAQELPVTWAFNDLEDAGWASRETFVRDLDRKHRFLIVTEGSSDASIIRHALQLLRPQIADFFDYVDMEEGYPFSGTGNVLRFVQGLISISVMNNLIVLFDNDAEGGATHKRCSELSLPPNMRVLKLPDLPEFEAFPTVGPTGEATANINGKGAAIECYLDLGPGGKVRWGGFNSEAQAYQGALIDKQRAMRTFLDQRSVVAGYDYSKLQRILDMLVAAASNMREAELDAELDRHY